MIPSPSHQGDLDGLCGVYAILNSLAYLYPKLTGDEKSSIFRYCLKSLKRSRYPEVFWDGTETEDLVVMLKGVSSAIRIELGHQSSKLFRFSRPIAAGIPFDAFFRELYEEVTPDERVAIIGIEKPWEHWTVARTVTDKNIVLQDSCGLHEIHLANSGLPGSGAKYEIDPGCTFLLWRN